MGLERVWVQTLDDGLVRADQVVGVLAHRTASFAGKPARWLLDIVLPVGQGAGGPTQWQVGASHRTLLQTGSEPHDAPVRLAELMARLGAQDTAGVITVHRDGDDPAAVGFRFRPFTGIPADDGVAPSASVAGGP